MPSSHCSALRSTTGACAAVPYTTYAAPRRPAKPGAPRTRSSIPSPLKSPPPLMLVPRNASTPGPVIAKPEVPSNWSNDTSAGNPDAVP
eukprot:2298583-Rhodomonas_salina.2